MRHFLVGWLCLCVSGLAWAQQNDCAVLTRQALDLGGVTQSLDAVSEMAATDAFMSQVSGSDAQTAEIATLIPIVKKHFDSALLRRKLEGRMAYDCNSQQMSSVIAALQSPIVARMLALEAAAITPEGRQKSERYARAISIAPPPEARLDAIEALDSSAGCTDYSVDSSIALIRGMMAGLEIHTRATAEFESRRNEMAAQMHRDIQISMLSVYRTATTDDLREYAQQLGAEPLKTFYERVKRTCLQILEEQARAMGHDANAALRPKMTNPGKNP
jgi:hypothetical protein